jgi:hypothetical protein
MKRSVCFLIFISGISFCGLGCSETAPPPVSVYITDETVSEGYVGNGVEWDPYQLDYGYGRMEISAADREKTYDRVDFMRPGLMRVMLNTTSLVRNGRFDPEIGFDQMSWILDYCQSRSVTVIFGDWGGGIVDARAKTVNHELIASVARYVDWLVNEKGYTCIKHYNLVNEPNGNWSAADGDYSLWARAIRSLLVEFDRRGLAGMVSLAAPDVAIWTPREAWWVDSCATYMALAVGLYDIHTYPAKSTVNSGEYSEIISAYRAKVPAGKKIVMGEIGLKFITREDSLLNRENIRRAREKPYASVEDSQMFVYDHVYGVDMADALFQTANSGFSGSVVWRLDDAMSTKEARDKLKVWGFWNILGEEFFGAEEEVVRPWFYAWSLLCRNMPAGCRVVRTEVSGDGSVKSLAVEKEGGRAFALVNVSKEPRVVSVESGDAGVWSNVAKYVYAEGMLRKSGDHDLLPNETGLTLDMKRGITVDMPGESLIVYTDLQ